MLTNKNIAQITAEVESGELTKEKLLDGIASAQQGEDMRKYIYAILLFWIGGGTLDHSKLENRSTDSQHPMSAIDGLLELIYGKRAEETSEPKITVKYTGEISVLSDMPADSWVMISGTNLQPLLGASFPWTLGASRTYKISRHNWSVSSQVFFEIESITGLEHYFGYSTSGDISSLKWNNLSADTVYNLGKHNGEIIYTELEEINGRWTANGAASGTTSRIRSQLIPVVPGKTYYMGYRFDADGTSGDTAVSGAFFNESGRWVAPLMTEDFTEYTYRRADGGASSEEYAPLYMFTVPNDAYYFSCNMSKAYANTYRQCISSSPILALAGNGNYGFDSDYAPYQAHKDKKLCVIGASGVAYNRTLQTVDGKQCYIVGFQEYLAPWYKSVDSYGFAGGGYRQNDASEYPSIYKGIIEGGVVGNVDLNGYDEFLFIPSTNDLTLSNMGEIDSSDTATYFGGLNAIISKIYTEAPNAKIYLANAMHKGSYYTNSGTKEKIDTLNAKIAALADYDSLQLIDLAGGSGINRFNYAEGNMTFDGTHLNQEGNKRMGLYLRKEMVGI